MKIAELLEGTDGYPFIVNKNNRPVLGFDSYKYSQINYSVTYYLDYFNLYFNEGVISLTYKININHYKKARDIGSYSVYY